MSDFRDSDFNYRNANDPLQRNASDPLQRNATYDPDSRAMNATWGWVAAAVFVVVVLAVAFGFGHKPGETGTNTAYNDANPPAVTHMAPPATQPAPSTTPAPTGTPAPVTPAPSTNGQ
jgi:hypothetical protein